MDRERFLGTLIGSSNMTFDSSGGSLTEGVVVWDRRLFAVAPVGFFLWPGGKAARDRTIGIEILDCAADDEEDDRGLRASAFPANRYFREAHGHNRPGLRSRQSITCAILAIEGMDFSGVAVRRNSCAGLEAHHRDILEQSRKERIGLTAQPVDEGGRGVSELQARGAVKAIGSRLH
jgi:hypothetical protein